MKNIRKLLTNIFRITTKMFTIVFNPFESHCLIFKARISWYTNLFVIERYKSFTKKVEKTKYVEKV